MRASDLIGQRVVDAAGRSVGIVTDIRCIQDGPLLGAMASLRVDALIVSTRHTGSLLGYDRRDQQGPWLIRSIVRALHRHLRIIAMRGIDIDPDGQLRIRADVETSE